MTSPQAREFDLQPHPRILPMLGEINLDQWRCLAELIDNAVDGFLESQRAGEPAANPQVAVTIPTSNRGGKVTVRDNGSGMDAATLESAVRAGWTSHSDPINNLGLFGMGFNIATARLGTVTKVWSTRGGDPEWYGVEIDFEVLIRTRAFKTPLLTRPKAEHAESGTEVSIERLKPDHAAWFGRASNRAKIQRDLAKTYAAMLRADGVPISFSLEINGQAIRGRNHCVWGGPTSNPRATEFQKYGLIEAYQRVDKRLSDRPFCVRCWQWGAANQSECPACAKVDQIVHRERHVRGWVGVQRYLSENEYGIDFLRNGRKIETDNWDLFFWNDGEVREKEYPIDDPRDRGRLVGEIHLDHCRVTYMKDRFERADPAWEEMVRMVRGEGPLRPDKALEAGFGENSSPLFKLFQAFRRSSPQNKKAAGAYARLLMVRDNDRAREMAKRFYNGDTEYQADTKWWELAEEADRELLTQPPGGGIPPGGIPGLGGTDTGPPQSPQPPTSSAPGSTPPRTAPAPLRKPIPSLTREYKDNVTDRRYDVRAFQVEPQDPDLPGSQTAWVLRRVPVGHFEFLVNAEHQAFRSATMTPLDALITELAVMVFDFTRGGTARQPPFADILTGLRDAYAKQMLLEPAAMANEAQTSLSAFSKSMAGQMDATENQAIFGDLSPVDQAAIMNRMATRLVRNPQQAIAEGRFLEYAPRKTLLSFFEAHPELFLDGKYWEDPYEGIEYPTAAATEEARSQVVRYYSELLGDAVWLTEKDLEDLAAASRAKLLRAALALELLAPAHVEENE